MHNWVGQSYDDLSSVFEIFRRFSTNKDEIQDLDKSDKYFPIFAEVVSVDPDEDYEVEIMIKTSKKTKENPNDRYMRVNRRSKITFDDWPKQSNHAAHYFTLIR